MPTSDEAPSQEVSIDWKIRSLISAHSEKKGKKVSITHPGFSALPKEGRQIIEIILKETYRKDFEILRKAFDEKLELYLRTTSDILAEAECDDAELQNEINAIRQTIAEVLRDKTINDEDTKWLNKIGFNRADIIDLSRHCDISGSIADLKEHADTYQIILGDKKYIKKILKLPDGLRKLQFTRTFQPVIQLKGSDIARVLRSSGWEEKLKYFEDPEKLKRLTEAGFNGYHLSQIVRNAGWEEKLKYFEDPEKLKRLTEAGFEASHLSQIVHGAGWEEKLKYFEDPEKLKRLTEAGFNGYHLSQIVHGAGWEEKLKYFNDPEKLERLTEAGFEASHLSQIVRNAGWEEKLSLVLASDGLKQVLRTRKITHNKLAKMLKKKNWRQLVQEV